MFGTGCSSRSEVSLRVRWGLAIGSNLREGGSGEKLPKQLELPFSERWHINF